MADEANSAGKVVTFYSFKGGTGRTMALANVAWILASNGLKVLVLDWDLDSPGLHRYFHPFLDPAKVAATQGIIELITDYAWDATQGGDRSAEWVRKRAQILPHAVSLTWEFPDGGMLDFVSAGRQNRDYSSAVTAIDWDNFYDRLGGGQFFDALRADMRQHYDYTLIDSRTGLSDIADICTVHLPDTLVDCFTLNDQSIDGAAAIARNVEQRFHYRKIQVLPVPMRIDEAEKDKADVGLATARSRFSGLHETVGEYDANDYWAAVAIPYKPFYAFEETLAIFGDAPRSPLSLLGAYERLTSAITDGRVRALGPMSEETRLTYKAAFIRPRQPPPGDIYLSYVPEDRMWADWIAAVLAPRGDPDPAAVECRDRRRQHQGRRGAWGGGGQPHDRPAVGRLPAVAAGSGGLGCDGGRGPGRNRSATHPGPGRRGPAGPAVLGTDSGGPDASRSGSGERGTAQGTRLPAENGRSAHRPRAEIPAYDPAGMACPDTECVLHWS